MKASHVDQVLREVEYLLADHALAEWSDVRLLERFVRRRDAAAFAALLHRHDPMVVRVCRGILPSSHDAEDAFQATFLILACNAAKVRELSSVGRYLHGTASGRESQFVCRDASLPDRSHTQTIWARLLGRVIVTGQPRQTR